MKNLFLYTFLVFLFIGSQSVFAQKSHGTLYNPSANAQEDITKLLSQAKEEGKHLVLQVGGNWCGWCYKFNNFIQQDSTVNKIVDENFLVYHLNFSKENKNVALLKKYEFPQRMGFPVLVILDADGRRIHTQDSSMLESGDGGYDEKKVANFYKSWTAFAIDPVTYETEE